MHVFQSYNAGLSRTEIKDTRECRVARRCFVVGRKKRADANVGIGFSGSHVVDISTKALQDGNPDRPRIRLSPLG
jgi:hypothetical protein